MESTNPPKSTNPSTAGAPFDAQALSDRFNLGPISERFERGAKFQHALDPSLPDTIQTLLADTAPDFGRIIVEFVFGDIYARPGLDFKLRVLATLAAVTALNQVFAVKEYIRFALNVGFTQTEIVEVSKANVRLCGHGSGNRGANGSEGSLRGCRSVMTGGGLE